MISDDVIDEPEDDFESGLLEKCVKLGQLEPFIEPDGKTTFEYTPHGEMMMELLTVGQMYFDGDDEGWELFQELVVNKAAPELEEA